MWRHGAFIGDRVVMFLDALDNDHAASRLPPFAVGHGQSPTVMLD